MDVAPVLDGLVAVVPRSGHREPVGRELEVLEDHDVGRGGGRGQDQEEKLFLRMYLLVGFVTCRARVARRTGTGSP
jgi:hypothetical protein